MENLLFSKLPENSIEAYSELIGTLLVTPVNFVGVAMSAFMIIIELVPLMVGSFILLAIPCLLGCGSSCACCCMSCCKSKKIKKLNEMNQTD